MCVLKYLTVIGKYLPKRVLLINQQTPLYQLYKRPNYGALLQYVSHRCACATSHQPSECSRNPLRGTRGRWNPPRRGWVRAPPENHWQILPLHHLVCCSFTVLPPGVLYYPRNRFNGEPSGEEEAKAFFDDLGSGTVPYLVAYAGQYERCGTTGRLHIQLVCQFERNVGGVSLGRALG